MDKGLKIRRYILFHAVLAGFILTACDNSDAPPAAVVQSGAITPAEDDVVAKVGREAILYSDVRRAAMTQGLIDEAQAVDAPAPIEVSVFNQVLDGLVDQKLLAQYAQRKKLYDAPDAKRRLAVAREQILSSVALETHIRDTVTDVQMRKLYDAQAQLADFGDEIRARHILVESQEDALEVMKQLGDEGDFEALAADISLDADTRDRGGDLGYFTFDMLAPDFSKSVFTEKKGKGKKDKEKKGGVLKPFKTGKGWHIVEILDRRRPNAKSYEQSRESLRNFLTFEAIESFMTDLRKEGDVTILPITPTSSPSKTPQ